MRPWFVLLFLLLPCMSYADGATHERWAVYYGEDLPAELFYPFDLIVFDSDRHPPIEPLLAKGKQVLGYISLGEAESYRADFKDIKKRDLLLAASRAWKGHYMIDIRKESWKDYVLNVSIPNIVAKGFNGLMLDTIDSSIDLEEEYPAKYPGMKDAAVSLIKAIHARYPELRIMLNRGFALLPQVSNHIDMVMAENIYTDMKKKRMVFVTKSTYETYVGQLNTARTINPALKVYTLDYWPLKDKKNVTHIYAVQRAQGFIPYVSHIALQTLAKEPE